MLSAQELAAFPEGFFDLYRAVATGEPLPREFAHVWGTSDRPHFAYPLRSIPDIRFKLVEERSQEKIGTIEHEKALREAYPGATYLHFGRAYRVTDWQTNSYEHKIVLRPVKGGPRTQALLSTHVSVSTARGEVISDHLLEGTNGTLAEIHLQVGDAVEGYRKGNQTFLYGELSKTDSRMRRKRRQFSSTGVLLRLTGTSFDGDSSSPIAARRALAEAVAAVAARELGIAPAEIRTAHLNVVLCGQSGARRLNDAVVIFDDASGGLRLTRSIFERFSDVLERLKRGAQAAAEEALLGERHVAEFADWYADLAEAVPHNTPVPFEPADSEYLVYAPGSLVGIRVRGVLGERRLIGPEFVAVGDSDQLMYRYESEPGVSAFTPQERIEAIGDDYRFVIWNPTTGAFRELPA